MPHPIQFIRKVAKEINTHPALVLGSLAKEKILHGNLGWANDIYQKANFEKL